MPIGFTNNEDAAPTEAEPVQPGPKAAAARYAAQAVRQALKKLDTHIKAGALVDPAQRAELVLIVQELDRRARERPDLADPQTRQIALVKEGGSR